MLTPSAPSSNFAPAFATFLERFPVPAGHVVSSYAPDESPEARAYSGCRFALTGAYGTETRVVFRAAKVTPTKAGLFVTLWKRDDPGITRPYSVEDGVDEFWVVTETPNGYGYFAFTAQSLVDSGVLASSAKPGKRGFRLYTPWDTGLNASATKAWAWQRKFFTALER